jgi:predicted polyphosphate/ATP-dependent NAD kinase
MAVVTIVPSCDRGEVLDEKETLEVALEIIKREVRKATLQREKGEEELARVRAESVSENKLLEVQRSELNKLKRIVAKLSYASEALETKKLQQLQLLKSKIDEKRLLRVKQNHAVKCIKREKKIIAGFLEGKCMFYFVKPDHPFKINF